MAEETQMPGLYALAKTETGLEAEVVKTSKMMEPVDEVFLVCGTFNLTTMVKVGSADELKKITTQHSRKLDNVKPTLTMNMPTSQFY
jgi:hypothetical protein